MKPMLGSGFIVACICKVAGLTRRRVCGYVDHGLGLLVGQLWVLPVASRHQR